jgi:hypothetical protein
MPIVCAWDHQEKLSNIEMLATKCLKKVCNIEGKVTLLGDKLAEQYVNTTATQTLQTENTLTLPVHSSVRGYYRSPRIL